MSEARSLAALCTVALISFGFGVVALNCCHEFHIRDEFGRRGSQQTQHITRSKTLRTMKINHHDLQDKFVIFLDIDGVIAPYGLDPHDDETDDDTSHFKYDDATKAGLQENHCWRPFTDEATAAFSSILEAIPADMRRVVLSSYWRLHGNCRAAILEKFHAYGNKFGGPLKDIRWFDDRTGERGESGHFRRKEIAKWLHRFNPRDEVLAGWIVLDDADILHGESTRNFRDSFMGHVVQPDENIGLTHSDAKKAIILIQQQLKEA